MRFFKSEFFQWSSYDCFLIVRKVSITQLQEKNVIERKLFYQSVFLSNLFLEWEISEECVQVTAIFIDLMENRNNIDFVNVKYKRTDAPSLWHQQQSTTVDIHGPQKTRGATRCPRGVSVSCLASCTRHECPRHHESVYMKV